MVFYVFPSHRGMDFLIHERINNTKMYHNHHKIIDRKETYHSIIWILKIDIWMHPASPYCLQDNINSISSQSWKVFIIEVQMKINYYKKPHIHFWTSQN